MKRTFFLALARALIVAIALAAGVAPFLTSTHV